MKVLETGKTLRLDLGCGKYTQEGFVGVDIVPPADILWDLEQYPWKPLPDECANMVIASHLVEFLNPHRGGMLQFMDEVWRILKPDARFVVSTWYPNSRAFFADPCHVNAVNEVTWKYFDPLDESTGGAAYKVYKPKPWKIEHMTWNETGTLEVSLIKRREDISYE
jgi:SAM-dependent methyltransferase